MGKILIRVFLAWIPLAIAITGTCLLVYVSVQQNYRQSLNDPQVRMAEDTAKELSAGATASQVLGTDSAASSTQPSGRTDMAASLAPWVAVYDDLGTPIDSTGLLNKDLPRPPQAAFNAAANNTGKDTDIAGQNRITWQPEGNVRQAIVIQHFTGNPGGYVVAGRNMREIEVREGHLSFFVALAWLVLLIGTFLAQVISSYFRSQMR